MVTLVILLASKRGGPFSVKSSPWSSDVKIPIFTGRLFYVVKSVDKCHLRQVFFPARLGPTVEKIFA